MISRLCRGRARATQRLAQVVNSHRLSKKVGSPHSPSLMLSIVASRVYRLWLLLGTFIPFGHDWLTRTRGPDITTPVGSDHTCLVSEVITKEMGVVTQDG